MLHLSEIVDIQSVSENDLKDRDPDNSKGKPPKKRKSLDTITRYRKWLRLKDICSLIQEDADENGVTTLKYMSLVVKQLTYQTQDRKLGLDVSDLLENGVYQHSLSLDTASYLRQRCKLGRTAYQDIKIVLKENDSSVIPTWKELRSHQISITPELISIDRPIGVKCQYISAI